MARFSCLSLAFLFLFALPFVFGFSQVSSLALLFYILLTNQFCFSKRKNIIVEFILVFHPEFARISQFCTSSKFTGHIFVIAVNVLNMFGILLLALDGLPHF